MPLRYRDNTVIVPLLQPSLHGYVPLRLRCCRQAALSPTGYANRRWAVVLLPALGLGLSNALQKFLESGVAGTFVSAVNKNLPIDAFKGLVATSVVSIVAIISGGSAGALHAVTCRYMP